MADRTAREQYAEVLAAHRSYEERSERGTPVCGCGHDLGMSETWPEHVADALAAVVLPDPEQAVREALDKVAVRFPGPNLSAYERGFNACLDAIEACP